MVKHNNLLPNAHFRKKWHLHIKTWFNQQGRKTRRSKTRLQKAKTIFPRPTSANLLPIVHCQTRIHNSRKTFGRGFTLDELRAVGIGAKFAPTIGISVDTRRKTRSLQSLDENVARLKEYLHTIVLLSRKSNKKKAKNLKCSSSEITSKKKILHHSRGYEKFSTILGKSDGPSAFANLRHGRG